MSRARAPRDGAHDDSRAARRLKVFHVAQVGVAPAAVRCHILNLSHAGALIDCRDGAGTDTDVTLAAEGFAREAAVRWRDGTRLGVRFHLPLDERELLTAL